MPPMVVVIIGKPLSACMELAEVEHRLERASFCSRVFVCPLLDLVCEYTRISSSPDVLNE